MMKLFRFFLVTALCIWSSIVQGQSNSGFQLAEDMEVTLELGDLYMNCGGALVVSESDMKSLIFDKLGQSGLTKQEFENAFDLDREGGQWARRYYKSSTSYKLAVREKEQVAMNYISSFTADNNWFGRVSYTPYNGTSKVLVWYLTDDSQTGGMSYRLYEKLREISGANSWSRGENTKRVSTVVRFGNKGTDKSIWVTLLLREGKIHFEYCTIENRDPSKWSDNVNTNVISLSSSEEKNIVLTNYWTKPDQMVRLMGEQRYFSKFIGSYGMSPAISFAFTYPIQGINSLYSASNNTWVVKGASGTSWTLTLRYHDNINDLGTSAIVAIKKDNMNYGPEEVAYLDGNNYDSYGRGVSNTTLHFCGVEDNSDQYPAAMDLINNPDYFVAYLKINIYHYCYDPIVDSPFFNVTVEGLGNQIEQEYLAEIQEMKKSCNELKATIDNKYSELTEGKLLVPYQLKTLQLYFIEYNEKIDDMLKKLDEAEENVKSISSESFNELKSEISFYIQNISPDLFSPPVETYFTCSDGGMFSVDGIEVRNETKTISIFTDKLLYFDNIYVIPDEGYRIASLIIDNQETTKTQFDFDYAGSNFVAFFEPIPNTSPKREIKVKTAGTLSTLIPGSEKYYIKELILTGELNGTDFRLLRDMAGNNYLGQNTSGKLKVLDLSNAKVVAGGESYLYTDHIKGNDLNSYGSFYYQITENDVFPDYVFYGCYLEKIDIPNSTKSIGNSALSHCSGLTAISIPNSVQAIGDYAFSNCSGVSSVTIPKSVTDIGINPFTSCRGLSSIKVENGNDVFDSRNNCNAIISSSNNELIVGCNKTVIPNSVTSIGNSAFANCSDITSITIPNSVKNIELSAFFSCSGLTTIVFPNSVTTIGGYAFQGCSGLTSITIPNSVKSIGDNAFSYCGKLKDVISEIKSPFEIRENVFSNYTTATLTVPRGTKSAYQSTNYWNKFTNIVETSGIDDLWLKEIQEMKSNCENLLSGVPQKFDSEVARFNLRIEEQNIYLEENNKILHGSLLQLSYDLDDAEQRIEEGTMTEEYMQNLREEYERVSKAFDEMRQFYDEVSHNIVEAVFQCNEGGVIKLGANKKIENQQETIRWTTVEKLKFSIDVIPNDGYSIKSIQVNGTPVSGTTFSSTDINGDFIAQFEKGGSNEKLLELQRMIKGCSDILSEIDKTYTDLTEGREFLPMHKEYLQRTFETMEYDVNQLKEKLEQYETNMEDLTTETLNSLVKEYEELMQKMTLDSDYSPLGSFPSCLQSGTFSCGNGGCMKINNGYEIRNETKILYSFYPKAYNNYFDSYRNPTFTISLIPDDGYRIASLKVGGNETTKTTFDSFEATNSFVATFERVNNSTKRAIHVATAGSLPDSIAESEKYIIEELTLTGELNGTDFRLLRDMAGCDYLGKDTDGKLKVLDISGAKIVAGGEKYLDTDQVSEWSGSFHFSLDSDNRLPNHIFHGCKFTTVIVSSNATSIGDFSFADCGVLTSITIPNSVTNIGFSAFINCSNLTSIMIPNSVTTIGKDAFNNCSGLASITISSAITKIENSTFFGCKSLSSITIPNAVTSIGSEAFYGCIGLTSITIPNSVISIGSFAFYNCHNLPTITIPNSVTSIGGYAFHYCSSLTSIISGIVNPFEINENVFSNYSKPTLTVPSGTKPAYQSTAAWNKFTNIIESASSDVRFTQQGITYRGATSTLKAEVRSVNDDKVVIPATVSYGGSTYDVTSVADGVLSNRTFDYVSLPSTITSLESSTFSNSTLGALIWNANTSLPSNVISNMAMPTTSNFLLYVNKKEFAPSNVSNVVVGNTATSITLADGMNTRFYCPRSFTAQTISYTHHYGMMTGGNGKGWETIALPFDVQRIEHKTKGEITPFASYQSGSGQRPFWLYEFGSNGFRRTDAIKANTPYIISMPNDSKYDDEYILAGDVVFSATSAQVYQTESLVKPSSNDKTFIPAFAVKDKSSSVYALNVSNELVYNSNSNAGSEFVSNLRSVYPFEAYMTTSSSSARSLSIVFDGGTTGIDEIPLREQRVGIVKVYNLTGMLVMSVPQSDFAEKWQSLPSGVYIVNGQKMIKSDDSPIVKGQ